MLTLFDHALALLLAAWFPIWGATFGFRRLRRASPGELPRVRRSVYRAAILLLWTLTAATFVLWAATGRDLRSIGLQPVLSGGLLGCALGLVVVVVYVLRERRFILSDPEGLEMVRRRLSHIEAMLPRTAEDLRLFVVLSITAGVCEEILYRGYLIWYFMHFVGLVPAAGLAALLFGIGHAYQGPRGMLTTGVVGAFLAAVYALSGSLFVPIVLHALMDIHSGHLAFVAYTRADLDAAARESETMSRDEPPSDESNPPAVAEEAVAPDAIPGAPAHGGGRDA